MSEKTRQWEKHMRDKINALHPGQVGEAMAIKMASETGKARAHEMINEARQMILSCCVISDKLEKKMGQL